MAYGLCVVLLLCILLLSGMAAMEVKHINKQLQERECMNHPVFDAESINEFDLAGSYLNRTFGNSTESGTVGQ